MHRGGTLAVALTALLPASFAGWLVWDTAQKPVSRPAAAASPSGVVASPTAARAAAPKATPSLARPLAGKVIVIDPGHNPNNRKHTAQINRLVNIGTGRKACDTTGTATNKGYAEASFTLDVARRARAILEKLGATVKLTQNGDRAYGPCVDERARIGNNAHADAAISIHADGAPSGDRGFHIILPASVHKGIADTRAIVKPSRTLGMDVRAAFKAATKTSYANYINGGKGYDVRSDLGGLNVSRVPKVFIECANMRDAKDAAEVTSAAWRQRAAQGVANGLAAFLEGK